MNLDAVFFKIINQDLANPVFDEVMPFVTTLNEGWAGVFALLILLAYIGYQHRKKAGWILLGLIVAVGAADSLSYRVIKPSVQRLRPSFTLEDVELRVEEHSGYSFPSNHAANSFAGATLLAMAHPAASAVLFGYAFLVSFSRVYVGVHYPLDVLCGGFIGVLMGASVYLMMRKKNLITGNSL